MRDQLFGPPKGLPNGEKTHQAKLATRRGSRAAAVGGSDAGDPVRARAAMDESMPEKFKFRG